MLKVAAFLRTNSWAILRWAIALVYLWFATSQLTDPTVWVGYLPEWTGYFPIPGEMLVKLHAWTELVGAILLAAGVLTRPVAGLFAVHCAFLALELGGAVGVRDGFMALVMLLVALQPEDRFTLDAYWAKR